MQPVTRLSHWAAVATWLLFASAAPAEVTFQWAVVGDAGNAGDVQNQGTFGSVPYAYRISKHEVTNAQYVQFLNAKDPTGANTLELYSQHMTTVGYAGGIDFQAGNANGSKYSAMPTRENKPVTFVTWYDSVRFANWLHNGQGNGDTETGAYTLIGGEPTPSNGSTITRNAGATVFLTSENEWYKAAYFKGGGTNAGYWDHATQSDSLPVSDQPPGAFAPTNSANYYNDDGQANGYNDGYALSGSTVDRDLNDVGAYVLSVSAYGTFDQAGNVAEWLDTLNSGSTRLSRGAGFDDSIFGINAAAGRRNDFATASQSNIGIRIATIVPEPSGAGLIGLAVATLLRRRRRRINDASLN